jgi:hypothetical protein
MKTNNRWAFWGLLLAFYAWGGWFQHLNSEPFGMHQGAQADRMGIAYNYFDISMNFFQPRVMEDRSADGVVATEFPLLPYLAALCAKAFGWSPIWYRLWVLLFHTLGAWGAYRMAELFTRKHNHAIAITFAWLSSPLLFFYSAVSLPDAAALGLSMFALWQLTRFYFGLNAQSSLWYYALCISLAGLLKVSYFLPHLAFIALFLSQRIRPSLQPALPFEGRQHAVLWGPFLPIVAWLSYNKWLYTQTQNPHFLQSINPANSLAELVENFRFAGDTWGETLFPGGVLVVWMALWLFGLRRQLFQLQNWPSALSVWLLLGFLGFFLLFSRQFQFHDYYLLIFLPFFFMAFLSAYQAFLQQGSVLIGLWPIVASVSLLWIPFRNASAARFQLLSRFEQGNYWCQNAISNADDYAKAAQYLKREVEPSWEPVVIYDPSPNTALYFLKRQGIRLAPDFSTALSLEVMAPYLDGRKKGIMVINDRSSYRDSLEPTLKEKGAQLDTMGQFGTLTLVKLGQIR